jgi:GNAT superfamily N-acetyltransferase
MVTLVQAATGSEIQELQALFVEYFDFLRSDVDTTVDDLDDVPALRGYRDEIAGLPGPYALPEGLLLLAQYEGESAGCGAFINIGDGRCELKRLWVRPSFRGKKVGRALVESLINEARQAGYGAMVLNTVDILTEAQSLYRSLGFEATAAYYDSADDAMPYEIFMRLDLTV